jgi:uncharacterized protein YdeI (YjbR/CyaY-like superfamily)
VTVKFFATADKFAAWLARHSSEKSELIVGFYKRDSGRDSLTWPQAVDEALCVGWIDGVRGNLDEQSYKIRFTPRKAISTWSAINIERVRSLSAQGRMQTAGLQAFARRLEKKSRIYSYEQREASELELTERTLFRKHKAAWAFFESQPPGYRRLMIWRVVSAKRPATRAARLAKLIEVSALGTRL